MQQYARMTTNGPVNVPEGAVQVKYEAADGHHHFHLMHVMRYSLWNSSRTAEVAPGQKVGFCLYDLQQATGAPTTDPMTYTDAVTHFCRDPNYYNPNNPDAEATTAQYIRMGTSPGWRDVYDKSLSYQWVDVSDTAPGHLLRRQRRRPGQRRLGGRRQRREQLARLRHQRSGDGSRLDRPARVHAADRRREVDHARDHQVRRPGQQQPPLQGRLGARRTAP